MSNEPIKRSGFRQGVFSQSATQKEQLGTIRILRDGRKFRYARAGAVALSPGKLAVAAAVFSANVMNEACTAVHAIGDVIFSETLTEGAITATENFFAGGYLHINDGTGEGQSYLIKSSTAVAASTAITLTLADPIRVATAATIASEFTIMQSPWQYVVESATIATPIGITPIAVTLGCYYWAQTSGPAVALIADAGGNAVGRPYFQSTVTAGAIDGSNGASYYVQVGISVGTAGVTAEYKPIMLTID